MISISDVIKVYLMAYFGYLYTYPYYVPANFISHPQKSSAMENVGINAV